RRRAARAVGTADANEPTAQELVLVKLRHKKLGGCETKHRVAPLLIRLLHSSLCLLHSSLRLLHSSLHLLHRSSTCRGHPRLHPRLHLRLRLRLVVLLGTALVHSIACCPVVCTRRCRLGTALVHPIVCTHRLKLLRG